jgi:5-methylcytosine-specific restriction endonuclease McrA
MKDTLNKATVLVLNRNWQAIHVKTPAQAFCMMATEVATALDIGPNGNMRPVRWNDWLNLPIRATDNVVRTIHRSVRVPTVIVLARFAKVPKRRPKLSINSIWARDSGRCQYTGRRLKRDEGNIDHVIPRSRGGATTWTNCVLAHKTVNSFKANRLPEEVGLRLRSKPRAPTAEQVTASIQNAHNVPDWQHFLPRPDRA